MNTHKRTNRTRLSFLFAVRFSAQIQKAAATAAAASSMDQKKKNLVLLRLFLIFSFTFFTLSETSSSPLAAACVTRSNSRLFMFNVDVCTCVFVPDDRNLAASNRCLPLLSLLSSYSSHANIPLRRSSQKRQAINRFLFIFSVAAAQFNYMHTYKYR